ncbi:MAG: hypothetical protein HYS81_00750 [Candidatus Aenigmatarchaeota archaeon]|nr:MAG: hypothetical protein HYS81_00750 [Candidatus Aenigmarchaeota archaeon]
MKLRLKNGASGRQTGAKGDSNIVWWLGAFLIALIVLVVIVLLTQNTQSTAQAGWEGVKDRLRGITGLG